MKEPLLRPCFIAKLPMSLHAFDCTTYSDNVTALQFASEHQVQTFLQACLSL